MADEVEEIENKSRKTKREPHDDKADKTDTGPKEVKKPKKKHRARYILLYIAAIGFVFYAVITIINQNVTISEKRAKLSDLHQHINVVEIEANYLKKVQALKGDERDKYMEKIAKEDLGYVSDGERIFINVAGE